MEHAGERDPALEAASIADVTTAGVKTGVVGVGVVVVVVVAVVVVVVVVSVWEEEGSVSVPVPGLRTMLDSAILRPPFEKEEEVEVGRDLECRAGEAMDMSTSVFVMLQRSRFRLVDGGLDGA